MIVRELVNLVSFKEKSGFASTDIDRNIGLLKGSLAGLAGMFAVAAAGITGMAMKASQFEMFRARLETLTGSAEKAEEALSFIEDFAVSTPFRLEESIQAFSQLKAMGLDPTEEKLRAIGDFAAGMGQSMTSATQAMTKGIVGSSEMLRERFGVMLKREGGKATIRFKDFKKTVTDDAASIEAALIEMMDSEFGGAMARQLDTIGGKWTNFMDNISKTVKDMVFEGADKEIMRLVEILLDLTQMGQDASEGMGGQLASALKVVVDLVEVWAIHTKSVIRLLGGLENIVWFVTRGFGALTVALTAMALGSALLTTIGLIKWLKTLQIQIVLTYAKALIMPVLLGLAILALLVLVEDVVGFFQGRDSMVGDMFNAETLGGFGEALKWVGGILLGIAGIFALAFGTAVGGWFLLIAVAALVVMQLYNMWDEITTFFYQIFWLTMWAIRDAFNWVTYQIAGQIEWVIGKFQGMGDRIGEVWDNIKQKAKDALNFISNKVDGMANGAKKAISFIPGFGDDDGPGRGGAGAAAAMAGGGAGSPAYDAQRRAAEVQNNKREVTQQNRVEISIPPGEGATAQEQAEAARDAFANSTADELEKADQDNMGGPR